ncbi:hypothetical protein [Natronosalvus rutilus]|uniref:Uncharacterized protein n=1 Tax=Natronosalvus rutilus TaxID=2953753 RepID=A0A9E7SUD8_9EURY|nr:hypothetical protein [Natronosalvus rutilus]UTF52752.1 hypothetical protein NGM29_13295 [Natronosalvus rutilus]
MSMRKQAIVRLWALIWQFTVGYVLTIVVMIVGNIWMVIDLLWQLLLGSEGLSSGSSVGSYIESFWMWSAGQTVFAMTGGGDGKWRALP